MRSLSAAVLLATLAAAFAPSLAATRAAPAGPHPVVEPAVEAVVADLDGDGRREAVRLFVRRDGPGQVLAVDVWQASDAGWRATGPALTLRRKPWHTEALAFDPRWTDASGALPVRPIDGVRMLVARSATHDRVLVAVSLKVNDRCCLSVLEVAESEGGLSARSLLDLAAPIDVALAADLDGDGRDELVTGDAGLPVRSRGTSRADESVPRSLRVWQVENGRLERRVAGSFPARMRHPFVLGDTDGRPGVELALVGEGGAGRLVRVAWQGAGLLVDETSLLTGGTPRLDFTGVTALPGVGVAMVSSGRTLAGPWPAGERPHWHLQNGIGGRLVGALGEGSAARLVLQDPFTGRLRVLDAALRAVRGALPERPAPDRGNWLPRYSGPLPGGLHDGREAIIADGTLLAEAALGARERELEVRGVPPFAATQPIGALGPQGAWLATIIGLDAAERRPEGGVLRQPAGREPAWLGFAPMPGADAGPAEWQRSSPFTWQRAAVWGESRGVVELAVAADGYQLAVADRGASVVLRPADGRLGAASGDAGEVLAFDAALAPDQLQMVAVVTPDGTSEELIWRVSELVEGTPTLEASASTRLLSSAVMVHGRASGATSVTVDGRPAALAPDGAFSAWIDVPPLPRSVRLTATDSLGGTTSEELSVVGFVDYLSHPWLPAMPIVLFAALLAFRRGRITARRPAAEGFVELDLSALPGLERDAGGNVAALLPQRRRHGTRRHG